MSNPLKNVVTVNMRQKVVNETALQKTKLPVLLRLTELEVGSE